MAQDKCLFECMGGQNMTLCLFVTPVLARVSGFQCSCYKGALGRKPFISVGIQNHTHLCFLWSSCPLVWGDWKALAPAVVSPHWGLCRALLPFLGVKLYVLEVARCRVNMK